MDWIKRFVLFNNKRHPAEMGGAEVEAFLTYLAVEGKVAASTQNQAKAAVLFLYRQVLNQELPWLENVEQAKVSRRLPVVLTVNETRALLDRLKGVHKLQAHLLYGTGMRLILKTAVEHIKIPFAPSLSKGGRDFGMLTILGERVKAVHASTSSARTAFTRPNCGF